MNAQFTNTVELDLVKGKTTSEFPEFYYKDEADRKILEEAMSQIGFLPNPFAAPSFPDSNGFFSVDYSKKGTGLFGAWSDEEAPKYKKQLRAALKALGFNKLKARTKTFAEMI